jgi:hypothetical protein
MARRGGIVSEEQKELFHVAILRVLEANQSKRFGLSVTSLCLLVNEFGFSPTSAQVREAMAYMEDPQVEFVRTVNKGEFHPASQCWKITAKGTNHLAMHNE